MIRDFLGKAKSCLLSSPKFGVGESNFGEPLALALSDDLKVDRRKFQVVSQPSDFNSSF